MNFRPFHRGAYEHLWAEQRYAVMAVSWKSYLGLAHRFTPKIPHVLTVLSRLSHLYNQPRPEYFNAVLSAFGHINDRLDRQTRRELVEGFLSGSSDALARLYQLVIKEKETFLYGCRLFFPPQAFYKFWDFDFAAGLWLCLGPYLGLLSPAAIRKRLETRCGLEGEHLDRHIEALHTGVPLATFESWPLPLQETLKNLAAVVIPGTFVFLHPRFPHPLPKWGHETPREAAALLAIEGYWDKHPETIPQLPSKEHWLTEYQQKKIPEGAFSDHDPDEIYGFLEQGFQQQISFEPRHCLPDTSTPDESPSDVEQMGKNITF